MEVLVGSVPVVAREEDDGNGVVYWPASVHVDGDNYNKSLVIFNTRKERLDLIKFPEVAMPSFGFGESDGNILYIAHDYSHLDTWILQGAAWHLKQRISIQTPFREYQFLHPYGWRDYYQLYIVGVHPTNPQLIFISVGRKLVMYDVENSSFSLVYDLTGTSRELSHYFYLYVWPHWPPLFF